MKDSGGEEVYMLRFARSVDEKTSMCFVTMTSAKEKWRQ